jgi:hypothetical protein
MTLGYIEHDCLGKRQMAETEEWIRLKDKNHSIQQLPESSALEHCTTRDILLGHQQQTTVSWRLVFGSQCVLFWWALLGQFSLLLLPATPFLILSNGAWRFVYTLIS